DLVLCSFHDWRRPCRLFAWLACRVPMGQASEPARFPGPLFLVSLGLVAARSLGNYTESRHIQREMKAPLLATRPPPVVLPVSALPPSCFVKCDGHEVRVVRSGRNGSDGRSRRCHTGHCGSGCDSRTG